LGEGSLLHPLTRMVLTSHAATAGYLTVIQKLLQKTTAPLFSQLTKPLRKNQRVCNAYLASSAGFAYRWGTFVKVPRVEFTSWDLLTRDHQTKFLTIQAQIT